MKRDNKKENDNRKKKYWDNNEKELNDLLLDIPVYFKLSFFSNMYIYIHTCTYIGIDIYKPFSQILLTTLF